MKKNKIEKDNYFGRKGGSGNCGLRLGLTTEQP